MTGRIRGLVALLAVLVAAGACSAPVDSGPKTIRAASLPEGLRAEAPTTTTTTAPTGASDEVTVYFIGVPDNRLVPVTRRITPQATVEKAVERALEQLFAGPTTAEGVTGLRTAISGQATVLGVSVERSIATVDVSENFAIGLLPDQIAAFAQVVFTAVDIGGVTGVLFAQKGRRLEVPQGDGSFTSTPLGRASYAELTPR